MRIWEGGEGTDQDKDEEVTSLHSPHGLSCSACRGKFGFSVIQWRAVRGGVVRDVPGKFTTPENYSSNTWMSTAAASPSSQACSQPSTAHGTLLWGFCFKPSMCGFSFFKRILLWEEANKYIKSETSWLLKTQWVCGLFFCRALAMSIKVIRRGHFSGCWTDHTLHLAGDF